MSDSKQVVSAAFSVDAFPAKRDQVLEVLRCSFDGLGITLARGPLPLSDAENDTLLVALATAITEMLS